MGNVNGPSSQSIRQQLVWQTAQPNGVGGLFLLSSSQCENKGSILTHLPDFQGMLRICSLCETYRFLNAEQDNKQSTGQLLPIGCRYGLYFFITL